MAAIRRPVRSRPIRLFLAGMFAVPLVSLVALWALASILTVPNAISDHTFKVTASQISGPDVSTLTLKLPLERQETYAWLLSERQASKTSLLATRQVIDKVLPGVRSAYQSEGGSLSATARSELSALLSALGQLGGIRSSVDSGSLSASDAFVAYNGIVDAQYQFYDASINDRGASLAGVSVGATDAGYALEMASREAALADGAFAVRQGQMSAADRQLFISSAASRRLLLGEATALLTGSTRSVYAGIIASPTYVQFESMEAQISSSTDDSPLPVDPKTWVSVSTAYLKAMTDAEEGNALQLQTLSSSASNRLLTEAILAGGVGLAAVVVSIALMVWFGRRVTRDLTRLHGSVREMSEERLPRVVEQLRRGDDVDASAESPPPAASGIAEISQIAQSFGIVQGAAVAAAVDQARLRKGVNQVFLNISMRNQSLLHRQLSMLDSMERRTSDAGALADLFRLDHLTTRMRRHAEGLIILSGSTPGRAWRDPVPVVDVLRAAVAEVEDYVRVDVTSESRDFIAGNAVNDVIHLVAELVENATVFSPPNTRIEVRADRAGTGVVAEIEDRGLGLSEEELADINRRLASPPEFDPANTEQLGLFVVSRLAIRHAIKVSLRQSVYGGTTAIMVLPFGVIVREEEAGSPAARGEIEAASQPSAGAPEPSGAAGAGPDPAGPPHTFGVTGRHRLPAAATGRRAETGVASQDGEQEQPPPRPLPRPPWEFAQDPQAAPVPESAPAGERPPWEVETASPWSDAFSRSPVNQNTGNQRTASQATGNQFTGNGVTGRQAASRPAGSFAGPFGGAPSARPAPQAAASALPSTESHLGMPVRVPQASLAPQLRARREAGLPTGNPAAEVDDRSPEATRNMLITMQQGWERGRVDDLDDPPDVPDNGTER
jgi:signal transduction histidine kinase